MPSNSEAESTTKSAAPSREEAFKLLADIVAEHTDSGRSLTASEAYLQMRRKSYGGFNLEDFGYNRFRDLLAEASQAGYIVLDATRQGDYALFAPETHEKIPSIRPIRPDLWKAFIDWTPGLMRLFDIEQDQVLLVPAEPAPLEPVQFREIRTRRQDSPEKLILIDPVGLPQQLEWMREFAESASDPRVRQLLENALISEKPVKLFKAVLRDFPEYQRKWRSNFSGRVRAQIERWRDATSTSTPIRIDRQNEVEVSGRRVDVASAPPSKRIEYSDSVPDHNIIRVRGVSTYSDLLTAMGARKSGVSSESPADAVILRTLLHAAIDRMPAEELKNLRLPIGYLFEDPDSVGRIYFAIDHTERRFIVDHIGLHDYH
jgi:hypothetical protein